MPSKGNQIVHPECDCFFFFLYLNGNSCTYFLYSFFKKEILKLLKSTLISSKTP